MARGASGRMSQPDPLVTATALLPGTAVRTAAVFGIQDRTLAVGLLGESRVAQIIAALAAPPSTPPNPATRTGRAAAALTALQPWVAVPILLAVSDGGVHLCDWDYREGALREVARFPAADLSVAVEEYRAARRVSLHDRRSGYAIALTASVGRLDAGRSEVRDVLAALPQGGPFSTSMTGN
jgi:hypothetical protein